MGLLWGDFFTKRTQSTWERLRLSLRGHSSSPGTATLKKGIGNDNDEADGDNDDR